MSNLISPKDLEDIQNGNVPPTHYQDNTEYQQKTKIRSESMLNELKKYAEEQALYHHKRAVNCKEAIDEAYHRGNMNAYATIASIIERGLA